MPVLSPYFCDVVDLYSVNQLKTGIQKNLVFSADLIGVVAVQIVEAEDYCIGVAVVDDVAICFGRRSDTAITDMAFTRQEIETFDKTFAITVLEARLQPEKYCVSVHL